ncbi:MAG TPA: hypothetical protein VMP67_01810 [Candidatus Limnocylindria bacterium]|nr:hypothetical protein [Candidatus Limnocylindria bacterium]
MTPEQIASALIGAFFGAFGWLLVGLYMQRRANERQARNAARAVYFELEVNRINIDVALHHGVFQALGRSSFERLLPELATWLRADELETLARAYMSHAGYQQLQTNAELPEPVRKGLLERLAREHALAIRAIAERAFSRADRERLAAGHAASDVR